MSLLKNIFRFSSFGTLLFFILNISLLIAVFYSSGRDALIGIICLYLITVFLSFSPIGEWMLCLLAGAKKIRRTDMKIRLIPLLEVVYNKAIQKTPKMIGKINLKIIHDSDPNAVAIGRHTICVTDGIFELTDDQIMGIFAHEMGHLANRHTEIQLLIGGGNVFILGFILILKIVSAIIAGIVTLIGSIFAIKTRSFIGGCLIGLFTGIISALFVAAVWLWTKFCMIFLMWSMRENEYVADKYAAEIGFGYDLALVLDSIQNEPHQPLLRALYATHPNHHDRIGRLQEFGVQYSRY